ncbi:MAG: ABC transporter transmembrane domain-containing protein, partial [Ruminococcus flavefaciens]|nr:ABC transporter transmembrane domain-containing protein [Ruminococcus flavefaciens]
MKRIFANMKPYWYMVIMTLVLLIVQAYCDLALPQYTSDMIDVGIQNHGIQHVVPEKLTAEDMAFSQLFMNDEEKANWENCYALNGDVYERKSFSEKQLDELDEEFMIPLILTYQSVTISQEQPSHTNEGDFSKPVDANELGSIREQMESTAEKMGSSTMKSMGIAYAISCSEKAGVDIDSIQKKYLWIQGFKMFGMALLMLTASIGAGFLAAKTGAGVGRDLRKKIFTKVIHYSNTEMDHFSTASLITRSTNDVQQIQMVTAILLRMLMYAPIL